MLSQEAVIMKQLPGYLPDGWSTWNITSAATARPLACLISTEGELKMSQFGHRPIYIGRGDKNKTELVGFGPFFAQMIAC